MIRIRILVFKFSIILSKVWDTGLLGRLDWGVIVVRAVLILHLVEPISSIARVSSKFKRFRPHHILLNRIDFVRTRSLRHRTSKSTIQVTADLELRPLVLSLVQGELRTRLSRILHGTWRLWFLRNLLVLWWLVERTIVVSVVKFASLVDDNFSLCWGLFHIVCAETSLDHFPLSLGFMDTSKSWQFTIKIIIIKVFISSDVSIIDPSFMLGHEAAILPLMLSFVHLVSQLAHVLLGSSLLLLLLSQICGFAHLNLVTEHGREAFILVFLEPICALFV